MYIYTHIYIHSLVSFKFMASFLFHCCFHTYIGIHTLIYSYIQAFQSACYSYVCFQGWPLVRDHQWEVSALGKTISPALSIP